MINYEHLQKKDSIITKNSILSYIICVCPKKVVTLHRQIKKTSLMRNFITKQKAAKQIKDLISAVAKFEGKKCPLSLSQITRMLDLGESLQRFYISKYDGSVMTDTPFDESLYICIFIMYVDEDAYLLKII